METTIKKQRRGLALLTPEKRKEIAASGGAALQRKNRELRERLAAFESQQQSQTTQPQAIAA